MTKPIRTRTRRARLSKTALRGQDRPCVNLHTPSDEDLDHRSQSLFWSSGSIAIVASLSVSGALHHAMPDNPWRDAVVAIGDSIGFLFAVIGRSGATPRG